MTQTNPLVTPGPWNAVAEDYDAELLPLFSMYARDAIALAQLPPRTHVLDVAAGPGTLALLAAPQAERVVAVDFAESMLDQLRRNVAAQGLANVEARQGDGQALAFDDASFDAAFSMFGLIFFPDRAAGFNELRRVLRPGGRAAVSSWLPLEQVPVLVAFFDALRELVPELPRPSGKAPLSDPEDFRQEMAAAGFRDVAIHGVSHSFIAPSPRDFVATYERSAAPITLLRQRMGAEAWGRVAGAIADRLVKRFGPGPLEIHYPALIGVGTR